MKTRLMITILLVLPLGAYLIFMLITPFIELRSLTYFYLLLKYTVLAQSFNIIAGYVGYISFGHVAFFGLGGYITAILIWKAGLSSFFSLLLGGVGTTVIAALLGIPLLKLRGAYFAIATLALNEALRVTVLNVPENFAGGAFGIPLPQVSDPLISYYSMMLVLLAIILATYLLLNSKYGIALKSIREDEEAAMVMGINAPRYKVMAFAFSAFFMGIAGGIDLWYTSYIYPQAVFNIPMNVEVIAMTMLGGNGTILGPIYGAAIVYVLEDYVWSQSPFLHLILLGAILGMLVLFMPRGIMGTLEDKVQMFKGRIK